MRFVSEFDSRERNTRGLWKRRRWDAARLPFLAAIRAVDERSSPRRARVLMKRGRLLPIFRNANTYTPKTMKQILTPFRILSTLALLALAVGCSGLPSKEHTLQTAGFTARVPKTASQQQKLKSLPSDKVTVVQKDGKTYYIFPDAAHNLAYVGGPKEYQTYRQIRSQQKKAEEIQWKENAEQIEWGGWGS
jgi:hypothetical protein